MNQVKREPLPICQAITLQGSEKDTATQIHYDQIQFGNTGVRVWMHCAVTGASNTMNDVLLPSNSSVNIFFV